MDVDLAAPVFLVKGSDEVLLAQAVGDLVRALVGGGDRELMVDEWDAARYDTGDGGPDLAGVVDAARTPPFLTDRRVVVARHAGLFGTKDSVASFVDYLASPLETTSLVIVWERDPKPGAKLPAVPKALADAVCAVGGAVIDTSVADREKDRTAWIDRQIAESAVTLDVGAKRLLVDRVGGDLGRVRSVLEALVSTFGAGARLAAEDLEPYLGGAGELPTWELTDAIDRGDIPTALDRLARMLAAGRHPLQIMATLHGHVERMLRLEGSGVGDEKQAAELLGLRGGSTFRARKALEQARRLGPERLHEMVELLAQADLDLRGAKAWPDELVMEVLVARLAGRSRRAGSRTGSGRGSR
ncbi:DNA polymerase III subunit delta [Rhabdothermincola sediminis]|uniref:DNA polymerase III subunit delta n=1 Tax=Rhabdothermincola sediminis TaxID=2751370 RepID=UPI001AA0A46D|nr:DNA polymerase III subunit delta [Rhabdothermincola sediminis]